MDDMWQKGYRDGFLDGLFNLDYADDNDYCNGFLQGDGEMCEIENQDV